MKIEEFKEALKLYVNEHLELNCADLKDFDIYEFKLSFMINHDEVVFSNPQILINSYQGVSHA